MYTKKMLVWHVSEVRFLVTYIVHIVTQLALLLSDPCTEGEVRLNGDVVQVCHDEQWGLVCSHRHSWGTKGAGVVCDQVGIPSGCELQSISQRNM